ncbi:CaiB/BaiF CoA transferase family protein [Alcaligenes endophyticus]|uniref:CoA transferase n=1 Tax=Alcaligenes endophyticus TaxID=1929088 RepID=A0ABT8ELZ4_9BURK|nr:CoA transferase [Alcaligenes endophyticus]MCX5591200.1 CoA transferase [Alcaligenes endophyticus]MDN4122222.1 CoA transferase [Alcaligenes endophyticus]
MQKKTMGPLAGIRILDLSSVVMGPYATQILGDLGADIIKVESPTGDSMRAVGPMKNKDMGALFLHLNRNKRSVVLDLKQEQARQACLHLAQDADVFLFNTRPEAMARLRLDYETLQAVNPAIVYVGAYGFGNQGPYAGRPAYDDLIQGMTGLPALYQQQTGREPSYVPLTLADRAVGLHVAIAILAAVIEARQSGCGQQVEIPMFEAMSQMVFGDHLGGRSFEPALGQSGYARLLVPYRRPYATRDGYITALIYNDKHWERFFALIGRSELWLDARFNTHSQRAKHIAQAYELVAQTMLGHDTAYWLEQLNAADIPAAALHTVDSLMDDPHIQAVQALQTQHHPSEGMLRTPAPVGKYSRTPAHIHTGAPRLGQDTSTVLRSAGLSESYVNSLLASGAAQQAAKED